ncbi:hypothetical protein COEREDRAFT_14665 [Coemansia reversa NRRL 1564]|uniref:histone acetyltransferase n=1 Tax=Coemansia reversa (strain ATCC 12441 / NRRL 1564) TaxID=763665 RepID=A0A2G5BFQ1_COERN|nr:hypothetical protein COEREDRAFT_14665 [Coemansia reversa NRRL 1564]|eukprot:PIA17547.1 hypothetical protein COEREDRAFT_14665 [Coemansia reversa NRRL 1564]
MLMEHAHSPTGIAEDVAAALCALPAGNEFNVRVVDTADSSVESLTPHNCKHSHFHAENTLSRRVLVLVSQGDCLVAGLETREFVTLLVEIDGARVARERVSVDACIEKLDTSGMLSSRMPLARQMVAGYLCSLQKYRKALDVSTVGVHLFARAQHEYLFAKSQENPNKHILDDFALIKWWQRTINSALTYAMSHLSYSLQDSAIRSSGTSAVTRKCFSETVIGYCVIPGAEPNNAYAFTGEQADTANANSNEHADTKPAGRVEWRWGLPYSSDAVAHDCVLQFPDDPITRLLAEPHSRGWSVAMLLDMLSVSEECGSGHRAAYLSAWLPVKSFAEVLEASQFEETADQGKLTLEDYDSMLIALFDRAMDFSTADAASTSSRRFIDFLDTTFNIKPVSVSTTGPVIVKATTVSEQITTPLVNDLTAVIRKKRKAE